MLKNSYLPFFTGIIFLVILQGCSVEKFIPEDKLLYSGAKLKVQDSIAKNSKYDVVVARLVSLLLPEPNSKFLGMRPKLYFHYKAQQENPGFINKFLNKKLGEEPVYLSDVDPNFREELLINRMENSGFFYSTASSTIIENEEEKLASVEYEVNMKEPYTLEKYKLDTDSLKIYKRIGEYLPESPIEEGMRFDLSLLKLERERLERKLLQDGYYNFNAGFLIFEADTNQYVNKKFDLFLRLKKDVPEKAIIPYKISKVNIYPNYVLGNDSIAQDTVRFDGKNYIQAEEFFKPKRLDPYILINEGGFYDPSASRNTSRRLASIGAYKFVNIKYDEVETLGDSLGILEANIFLSPLNKRAFRAELQGVTKSNDFIGPHLALTYSNRNLFHGGEILNLTGKFGYEVQVTGSDLETISSTLVGLQADLIYPRLLFPISINDDWFEYSIPKTKISLSGDYVIRTNLYSIGSVSGRFGYLWNANRFVTHELNPVSINYVKLANTTQEFEDILDENVFLRNSFQQEFIAGLTYSFTYNGMIDAGKTHQFYLNANMETAGNTMSLFSKEAEEGRTAFGLKYAQFAKADADLRYHFNFGKEQKIATRLFAGLGIPFGNSDVMPFSKQYFSGGPYSVRAFRIRSLGPGSYEPEQTENTSYFDQSGNLRLEGNIEYRFPLISFLKGAVFADAGNVWTTRENPALPGGKFGKDFLSELGVGAGVGLRVDIQNFVIRLDVAAPMRVPFLPEGERWTFAFDEPIFNFAVGYPF
ncbi:BamA/TamA family outer membrane protein [Gillisia hiemivivida]|uniref:BamA/TamA family outer membrane protein n=1 Tax=Gillisia hiemivivida TaxID=291190 RepID=A0A5C6ZT81_9FLAO|nr:BamA/TamA family outer membrane protein [Gillisia hiemivivida]TXD94063.1 BamA/TamA family outer membrane protein [Gillisia hiemivivida]